MLSIRLLQTALFDLHKCITFCIDTIVQNKLTMSEVIEDRFKVDWTPINEKSSSRVCDTAP